ncbi:putative transposase [Crocosphaera watsonii WH 0005]|nr:putative transposase [Crocosphaera watsonii WH 0005]
MPLIIYLNTRKGEVTGISFIDSTRLPICSNNRATRNKVFEGLANWGKRGKTSEAVTRGNLA